MATSLPRFVRDNAFIVAAIALPVVVGAFFFLATAIPRWTVPRPAYDLVLRASRPYDAARGAVAVDFAVRNGRVEATFRPLTPPNVYAEPVALLLFDHETATVTEVPLEIPAHLAEGEAARTIVVEALANRRVSPQATAPDGYALQNRSGGSPGLVGELFGMGGYRQMAALTNRGRIVDLDLPSPYRTPYQAPVYHVGWILDEGQP